jgi:hypothetical protein
MDGFCKTINALTHTCNVACEASGVELRLFDTLSVEGLLLDEKHSSFHTAIATSLGADGKSYTQLTETQIPPLRVQGGFAQTSKLLLSLT